MEEHLIRKYANRRLYDATASRHVTLADIRNVIAAGAKVKVVDDTSGEDLTRATLLQIIASQELLGQPVLSDQLLEAIVRFYGNPVQEALTRYLEQSIGALLRQQQVMQVEMAKVLETPTAPLAQLARQNMETVVEDPGCDAGFDGPADECAANQPGLYVPGRYAEETQVASEAATALRRRCSRRVLYAAQQSNGRSRAERDN